MLICNLSAVGGERGNVHLGRDIFMDLLLETALKKQTGEFVMHVVSQ